MALNININLVAPIATIPANTKVADIVVTGGTAPYNYTLATGSDSFSIDGTTVKTKAEMTIANIASFSVLATDSASPADTVTSDVTYPAIESALALKMTKANIIYKITRYYDLGHATLTIPAGCTLDFQGGSFANGTIIGNNTKLKTNKNIFRNIEIQGTFDVPASYITPEIFGYESNASNDVSPYVAKCYKYFGAASFNQSTYYINTPLVIDGHFYGQDATFIISGTGVITNTPDIHFITIRINKVIPKSGQTIPVGIKFESINSSEIHVNYISSFTNNILLYAQGHGIAYNHFYFGMILDSDVALKAFVENQGWINENYFYGGRYASSQRQGLAIQFVKGDNGFRFDNNTFMNFSLEYVLGTNPIQLQDVAYFNFLNFRNENNSLTPLFKFTGVCYSNTIRPLYYLPRVDNSQNNGIFGVLQNVSRTCYNQIYDSGDVTTRVRKASDTTNYFEFANFISYTNAVEYGATSDIVDGKLHFGGMTASGIGVDVITNNNYIFGVYLSDIMSIGIRYLTLTDGTDVSTDDAQQQTIGTPRTMNGRTFEYNTTQNKWVFSYKANYQEFKVPDNVAKFRLVFIFKDPRMLSNFKIYSQEASTVTVLQLNSIGATSDRPASTYKYIGFQYYDTTLNKYIMWNGTAWVNMDGTALA